MKMNSMVRIAAVAAAISCVMGMSGAAKADTMLHAEEYLFPGQRLITDGRLCSLELQASDDNLVAYCGGNVVWTTNTRGWAAMQGDGNFVVYDWVDKPLWASGTSGHPGSTFGMGGGELGVISPRGSGAYLSWFVTYSTGSTVRPNRPALKTIIHGNTDRWGGDYAEVALDQNRYSWCAYYCSTDTQCKAFTYVAPGIQDSGSHCYLKNTIPAESAASGMQSGMIFQQPY